MRVYLEHHADPGYQAFNIKGAKDLKEAAYKAMRKSHTFLTDDNHEYEIKTDVPIEWGGKTTYFNVIRVYKPKRERPYRPLCPGWMDEIMGNTWFSVQFWKTKQ